MRHKLRQRAATIELVVLLKLVEKFINLDFLGGNLHSRLCSAKITSEALNDGTAIS
jgi:hypothetical protein